MALDTLRTDDYGIDNAATSDIHPQVANAEQRFSFDIAPGSVDRILRPGSERTIYGVSASLVPNQQLQAKLDEQLSPHESDWLKDVCKQRGQTLGDVRLAAEVRVPGFDGEGKDRPLWLLLLHGVKNVADPHVIVLNMQPVPRKVVHGVRLPSYRIEYTGSRLIDIPAGHEDDPGHVISDANGVPALTLHVNHQGNITIKSPVLVDPYDSDRLHHEFVELERDLRITCPPEPRGIELSTAEAIHRYIETHRRSRAVWLWAVSIGENIFHSDLGALERPTKASKQMSRAALAGRRVLSWISSGGSEDVLPIDRRAA